MWMGAVIILWCYLSRSLVTLEDYPSHTIISLIEMVKSLLCKWMHQIGLWNGLLETWFQNRRIKFLSELWMISEEVQPLWHQQQRMVWSFVVICFVTFEVKYTVLTHHNSAIKWNSYLHEWSQLWRESILWNYSWRMKPCSFSAVLLALMLYPTNQTSDSIVCTVAIVTWCIIHGD